MPKYRQYQPSDEFYQVFQDPAGGSHIPTYSDDSSQGAWHPGYNLADGGPISGPEGLKNAEYDTVYTYPNGEKYIKIRGAQAQLFLDLPARPWYTRLIHWLGHVLFDMDCAVTVSNKGRLQYCKACGRDVSL